MAKSNQKTSVAREFAHTTFELRDFLRQFFQKKFKEQNIDLTYEMHQVMACLWKNDGLRQQDLADKTLKDKASLTCLIDNLTKRNLVQRFEDANDRRSKLIFLTDEGRELGMKVEPWATELFTIVSKNIDSALLNQSILMVKQMIENVKKG